MDLMNPTRTQLWPPRQRSSATPPPPLDLSVPHLPMTKPLRSAAVKV